MKHIDQRELPRKLAAVAAELATETRAICLHHFKKCGEVKYKEDSTPVTCADMEVDDYLTRKLGSEFPEIPVVTEEQIKSHALAMNSETFFLVDPIDGTKEFVRGSREFTVNVALVAFGSPIAGFVSAPAMGVWYMGIPGQEAIRSDFESSSPISISVRQLAHAKLEAIASWSQLGLGITRFDAENSIRYRRHMGSSLKFCIVAEGKADIYPRLSPTMECDTAAGHAVLLAAGGEVVDLRGRPISYGKHELRNPSFLARTVAARSRTRLT